MCQHHFRCWFRSQCRGCHTDKEEAHFAECDLQAQDLGVQLEVVRAEQDTITPHELVEDIFHDAPLIPPARRRHRRLRKGQRARARRKDRAGRRLFRTAKRTECGPTEQAYISMKTEQGLRTKSTQTVQDSDTTSNTSSGNHHSSNRHTADSSAKEKEERVAVDAMVQTQPNSQDMASQCGPAGSAAETAETEEMREMLMMLDVAKGENDELQYTLEQVQEECKRLLRVLEHERGGAAAEEPHISSRPDSSYSREDLYAGYENCASDEEEKYCDY